MDMVGSDGPFENLDLVGVADLSDDFSTSQANIVFEHLFTVLGNPDQVVQTVVSGVAGVTILACHVHILLY